MIRTLVALLPPGSSRAVVAHLSLTVAGVIFRAVGVVLLVPLVAALFSPDPSAAWLWLALLAAATCAGGAADWATTKIGFRLGFGILDRGQRTVAVRIAEIRLTWFTAENTATARQSLAATGPDLVGLIIYLVTPLVGAVLLPLVIAIALIPIAWQLGAAALVGVVVLLASFWASGRLSRNADRAAAEANSRLTERVLEFARTQQALRAARRVEPARSHAGAALAAQHGAVMRTVMMQVPGQILFAIASQIALLILAGTTVALALEQTLTVPQAIALIVVIVRYLEPFTVLAELSPGIETTTASLRRIRDVLHAPVDGAGEDVVRTSGAPQIDLQDVSFGYDDGSPVLDSFSLTLEPGTTTAVVGPSGSGKSTVLSLIAGLQRPADGRVLVDGADLWSLSAAARHDLVSVVFQHPYLLDGSITENITVGDVGASDDRVDAVARLARVDRLMTEHPDGAGSSVGEAGGALSGGERQRVSIARALVKPAPVLLVDEATSALDTENETAVAAALTDDPMPRTRVIVAHRLSSIRAADRVVFLDDGRIVEDGTVAALLAAGGRFAEFWRQQHSASAWRIGERTPARNDDGT